MQGETPWHESGEREKNRKKIPFGCISLFYLLSLSLSFPPFLSFFPFHSFPVFTPIVWLLFLLHLLSYLFPLDLCCSVFFVASCTFLSYVLLQPALSVFAETCFDFFHVIISALKCLVFLLCHSTVC
jgi:hypothetical protein